MKINFNVTKERRKELVAAVVELTGWASVYKGAPTFAFAVNNFIIDRNGTIICDEQTSTEEIRNLLTGLAEQGFVFDGDIEEIAPIVPEQVAPNPEPDGIDSDSAEDNGGDERTPRNEDSFANVRAAEVSDMLVIEVPIDGFTKTALNNLDVMVSSKAALIMKAIGLPESNEWNDLPINETKTTLQFPWFPLPVSKDETDAYAKFVHALCELAKKQKRVTMKDADVDSEKFAMRCFLLRLGFIGDEYKSARRILLSKLSGNGSFKSGNHKRDNAPKGATNADSGEDNVEAISVHTEVNNADNTPTNVQNEALARCGECWHHCYYSDGLMRSKAGDIVDISKRKPDKYTHYCLGTPSGFRKIKHSNDWSGGETPTSWCPLHSESNNSVTAHTVENGTESIAANSTEVATYAYNPNLADYDALMAGGGN